MYKTPHVPSLEKRIGISVVIGIVIALTGSSIEAFVDKHAFISFESLDDFVIGIMAALVVFWYEQRRHRAVLEKLRTISSMNHHVRNALQAITYSPYAEQEKQIKLIEDSVGRIQWALREILPGEKGGADVPNLPAERAVTLEIPRAEARKGRRRPPL